MAVKTKAVLKAWHKAGYKDAAGDFDDLIDTMITAADNAASATEAGLVELATDTETQTGTATDRAITPANLQACTATATRKGVVELATDAETQAGSSTALAITPANLAACTATTTRKGVAELATDAEAKAGSDTARLLTPSNLLQSGPTLAAGVLTAAFVAKYTFAPDTVAADYVHGAITLPAEGTTEVTTEITDPDFARILSITGNAVGITGNVVIVGTAIDGSAVTDTIALSGTDTVAGVKAFATVTSITVPARNAEADTVTIGVGKSFGMPHVVANASCLLVKLFDGSADDGTLTVHADIESNLFALNGTPDDSKIVSLYYLI